MHLYAIFQALFWLLTVEKSKGISSPIPPFTTYKHSTELQANVADLWWTIDDAEREILFEMHVKTTGWIALGISPAGGMTGSDIGVGWVDRAGTLHFQDRYARNFSKPSIDSTSTDWIGLRGREENGWTAIQFKRLLETCDDMDVSIKYLLPSTDTTYYCKVFKIPPRFSTKRHAIGYKILVDPSSQDIVHHMTTYECDAASKFDDSKLPEGVCDDHINQFSSCLSNMANGWAIGGDHLVEYPQDVGYPIGGDFPVKYYMIQIHFDNAHVETGRHDSSGIRFYIGEELHQYDVGYLTLGTESNPGAIVIPPQASEFVVDAFCTPKATEVQQIILINFDIFILFCLL
ncbi:unnamed protein product [Rotaria sp. Silwood1]|nr:unnamed protein product [Rotaria sp. Silwood1]CAF1096721.1 unnamed protein product [Rotaria sp. Silwood1]